MAQILLRNSSESEWNIGLLVSTCFISEGEIVNNAVSQTNWKQCVWKNLNDNRDSGKIQVQKYLENFNEKQIKC